MEYLFYDHIKKEEKDCLTTNEYEGESCSRVETPFDAELNFKEEISEDFIVKEEIFTDSPLKIEAVENSSQQEFETIPGIEFVSVNTKEELNKPISASKPEPTDEYKKNQHNLNKPKRFRITSNEERRRLVQCYKKGEDFVKLATIMGIKRTTAYGIISNYRLSPRIERSHGRGRPQIIDEETIDFVLLLIESEPHTTLQQLVMTVRNIWHRKTHFSAATLSRVLEGELFTIKLARDDPQERNSQLVKDARCSFTRWMMDTGIEKHRVYVDEIGFNLWTRRTYGRAKGQRVLRQVGGARERHIAVIAGISNIAGVVYHEIHATSVTKKKYVDFIASLIAVLGDEDVVILMDNAPIHQRIQEIYPDSQFKKIPPHSPFLNPMENLFSVLKNRLKIYLHETADTVTPARAKREKTSVTQLRENMLVRGINLILPQVTRDLINDNYRHSNGYLAKCISRDDIVS